MHPTNGPPPSSSKSSSTLAVSSLRPRTRRLISVEDEFNHTSGSEQTTPLGSRAASPIPSTHPSRPNVTSNPSSSFIRASSASAPKSNRDANATFSGIWGNSWSAIQGLASNVLGTDLAPPNTSPRRRKQVGDVHIRTSTSAPPKQWGPPSSSASSHVGAGSQEERESLVRAMKRRDLLTANEHIVPDSVGRIKRRNSDDFTSASAPPGESDDRDALVYVHKVQPQDTLAGITIKFNCQPAVLRKANRMWPNDSVQTKKLIVLPVDACAVKGRPVPGPNEKQEEDLLTGDIVTNNSNSEYDNLADTDPNSLPNGWRSLKEQNQTSANDLTPVPSSSHSTTASDEPPWKHDSWVLLPNDKEPTQIGRMPRRALGFFPPARRKSVAYSDAATPSASFDLPRSSTSTRHTDSQANSPRGRPTHGRQRSTSNFSLLGPGGVGTMGRNVRKPGPAQDGLNKLFASHLPSVAPPPGQEYFTPWVPALLDADGTSTTTGGGSGARTPLGGVGLDLQDIGGAVEGWMRKMGTSVSKVFSEPSTPGVGKRSAVPIVGSVGGDLGDLIELRDDAFEIGDGEEERVERGRSAEHAAFAPGVAQFQSARPDVSLVMRDRGPKSKSRGESSKRD